MKKSKWNTPQQISLDTSQPTVVGRLPAASQSDRVVLHSEKLPFMLSREHASLTYNHQQKKWMLTDLKSLNGVFINGVKGVPGEATGLTDGDEICFGSMVPKNELWYVFLEVGKGAGAVLKKIANTSAAHKPPPQTRTSGVMKSEGDEIVTPPLVKVPLQSRRQQAKNHPAAKKKLKLESHVDPNIGDDSSSELPPTPPLPSPDLHPSAALNSPWTVDERASKLNRDVSGGNTVTSPATGKAKVVPFHAGPSAERTSSRRVYSHAGAPCNSSSVASSQSLPFHAGPSLLNSPTGASSVTSSRTASPEVQSQPFHVGPSQLSSKGTESCAAGTHTPPTARSQSFHVGPSQLSSQPTDGVQGPPFHVGPSSQPTDGEQTPPFHVGPSQLSSQSSDRVQSPPFHVGPSQLSSQSSDRVQSPPFHVGPSSQPTDREQTPPFHVGPSQLSSQSSDRVQSPPFHIGPSLASPSHSSKASTPPQGKNLPFHVGPSLTSPKRVQSSPRHVGRSLSSPPCTPPLLASPPHTGRGQSPSFHIGPSLSGTHATQERSLPSHVGPSLASPPPRTSRGQSPSFHVGPSLSGTCTSSQEQSPPIHVGPSLATPPHTGTEQNPLFQPHSSRAHIPPRGQSPPFHVAPPLSAPHCGGLQSPPIHVGPPRSDHVQSPLFHVGPSQLHKSAARIAASSPKVQRVLFNPGASGSPSAVVETGAREAVDASSGPLMSEVEGTSSNALATKVRDTTSSHSSFPDPEPKVGPMHSVSNMEDDAATSSVSLPTVPPTPGTDVVPVPTAAVIAVCAGQSEAVAGRSAVAVGQGTVIAGQDTVVAGQSEAVAGQSEAVAGQDTVVAGLSEVVAGHGAVAAGQSEVVAGHGAVAAGQSEAVAGQGAVVAGQSALAPTESSGPTTDQSSRSPVVQLVSSNAKPSPGKPPMMHPLSSSAKPSPAFSVASTTEKDVDDLFGDMCHSNDRMLEEAMFGESSSSSALPAPGVTSHHLDGATMQVLAIQDQREREKHQLLSNIQALKNELAAKNEWILQREKDGGIMSSMKEEFQCVICQELFINAHTLPCSHSFCQTCIKGWMSTGHRVCPICRKRITTDPVHSLVLDNAIAKMEEKLSEEEKKERELTKEERKPAGAKSTTSAKPASTAPPSGGMAGPSSTAPISVPSSEVVVIGSDSESQSTEEENSDSDDDDDDDVGYGGRAYGRCYHCGQRGHWRPECPYR